MSFSPWCRRGVDLMDIILREDVENMFNVSRWAECSLLKFYKFTFSRKSKTCGYYTNKAHGSNEGNQHECILLLLLVFVLFSLNSRGRNRTAQEDDFPLIWVQRFLVRSSLLCLWLVCFVGCVLFALLKLLTGSVWPVVLRGNTPTSLASFPFLSCRGLFIMISYCEF